MVGQIDVSARTAAIEYAIRDVVVPAIELEKQGHAIIRLNIGDPLAYPGLPTPAHMISAFKNALDAQDNGYSPSYGIPSLRAAIASAEGGKGWSCTEDDVYVTHGVTEALQIIFAAFLETGDKILAPGPHYPPYMAYPQMFGATTIEYRLDPDDGWRIDLSDIRSKMDDKVRLLVLINPNNPTGNVATQSEIDALIEIAKLAVKRKTGARGLRSIMEDLFVDLMYESPDQKDLNKIVINSDVVTKKIEPMLVFSPKGNEKIAVNKS